MFNLLTKKDRNHILENPLAELAYRMRLMRIFNGIRFIFALVLVSSLLGLADEINIWRHQESKRVFFIIATMYAASLLLYSLLSAIYPKSRGLILGNALFDLVFVAALGVLLTRIETWNLLAIFLFSTTMLTVLTTSHNEGVVVGFFMGIMLITTYFVDIYFDYVYLIKYKNGLLNTITAKYGSIFEVLLLGLSGGVIIGMISRLINQTRESERSARLSSIRAEHLQALNNAIIDHISLALLVVDLEEGRILMMNRQANILLATDSYEHDNRLGRLSLQLAKRFGKWKEMRLHNEQPLEIGGQGYSVQFNHLDEDKVLVQLENILENRNKIRENRLDSYSRLCSAIAHEVKNPLASVSGSAQFILESESLNECHSLGEKIYRNSKRISLIINDILNIFSSRATQKQLVKLNGFIREVVEETRMNAELANIYIRLNIEESDHYAVYFDPNHLRQVIDNLLINSVKHCGRPDPIITIRTSRGLGERTLYLDVMDNGQGVAASDEERIFEPFYSSKSSPGLGLYLVREICLSNQGQISYIRQPQGACFRVAMECYLEEEKL